MSTVDDDAVIENLEAAENKGKIVEDFKYFVFTHVNNNRP